MNFTTLGVGIATGVGLGSVYALIGLSFTLVIASTGLFAFTLETVVALGGVLAYIFMNEHSMSLPTVIPLVVVIGGVCGLILERVAYRTLRRRAVDLSRSVLLVTIGLATGFDALMGVLFGTDPRQVADYVSPTPFFIDGVPIQPAFVVMALTLLVITVVMEVVLRVTSAGKRLLASQEDPEGAELVGINVPWVVIVVFVISGALACAAGFLVTPISLAASSTGSSLVVLVFAGLAVGGFGSPRGAIIGGLLAGLVAGIVPLYLSAAAVTPILMASIVLVLLLRPAGLFGQTALRQY